MVSSIYLCHWPDRELEYSRCEVLLHRSYHNDVPPLAAIIEEYSKGYLGQEIHQRGPFLHINGISYISLWAENDILILAVARRNVNAMSVIALLSQLQSLINHYFTAKRKQISQSSQSKSMHSDYFGLTRETIVDNHALLFELLDECVDFGLPQVTDYNILKEYIKMEVNLQSLDSLDDEGPDRSSDSGSDSDSTPKRRSKKKAHKKEHKSRDKSDIKSTHNRAVRTDVVNDAAANYVNSSIVRTQVSSISWRPKGIFYPKNEIYIDIIEECEFLYDLEAQAVRINQVQGLCLVRSYLSGMPVCKLGLNEKYISQVEYDENEAIEEEYTAPDTNDGNQLKEEGDTGEDTESSTTLLESTSESTPRLMKVPISNVQFHSCVELAKVYKDNLVFFTPPDDEFRLFSYTVEQQRRKRVQPILMVQPTYRVLVSQKKLQIMCTLSTNFRKRLHCNKVVMRIPVDPRLFPLDNSSEDNFRFKCEMGEVRFGVDSSEILWAIPDLPGSKKTIKLMAEVVLSDCSRLTHEQISADLHGRVRSDGTEPDQTSTISELDKYYGVGHTTSSVFESLQQTAAKPGHEISVSFEMPMFTYSGLKVTYLRVDEDTMKYTCFPWVRYATRAKSDMEAGQNSESGARLAGAKFRFKLGPSNFTVT